MTGAAPIKRTVAWSLLRSGALRLHRSHFEKGRAILLAYHRVNDERDPFFPSLPRSDFAAQVDYIASRYRVEPLDAVVAWLADGAPGPSRVAITIDDGYPDTFEVVLPILEGRGLPATLFLATGPPETGEPLWIDRIRWVLKHARATVLDVPALGLPSSGLGRPSARLELLARLLRQLKALGPKDVEDAVATLEAALQPQGPPLRLLRWPEVRRMTEGGISLAGHTHRHYMLSRLDEGKQEDEITTCLRLIEERAGRQVTSFAYPNGDPEDYDGRTIAILRRLGLRCAVTCRRGLARPGQDPFQLPRLYTNEPSLALFAARLAGLGQEERGRVEVS
ncbi:MAG TPA: polysaccharide deacetylase family protein [Vicinamibacteria bacterium]|nr:polysaccharide deacetylase family protein [Vicinamibacteria bacterium]